MPKLFRVGLTNDFVDAEGRFVWGDIGLDAIDARGDVSWEVMEPHGGVLSAADLAGFDAVIVNGPRIEADSFGPDGPAVLARFGVGYDGVDVVAATAAGVIVTNTPDGTRRPVALSAVTLVLSLAHRVRAKDRIVREGRWDDRLGLMGHRITGATAGIVGFGNIGRETARLLAPFGMRVLAHDPFVSPEIASGLDVELVSLKDLAQAADYLIVTVALTNETYGLIDGDVIGAMRRDAFLINVSRGSIVDESALIDALASDKIAGAGLDVFVEEPLPATSRLAELENVLLSPHALCWTEELAIGNGSSAIASVLAVADGRVPEYVVNREVLSACELRA